MDKTLPLNTILILAFLAFKLAHRIYQTGNTFQAIFIIAFTTLCITIVVFDIYGSYFATR